MKALRFVTSFIVLSAFVACAPNKSDDVESTTRLGAGPTGRNAKAEDCQVGQIYNSEFGCLITRNNQCPQNQGYSRLANRCVGGTVVTEQIALGDKSVERYYGTIVLKSESISRMVEMLQDAEVCGFTGYGSSGANCLSMINNGTFLVLDVVNTKMINVTIGAGTKLPQDLIRNRGYYQPMINQYYVRFSQKSEVLSYNYDNGVQIVATPVKLGLRVVIPGGRLTGDDVEATVYYGSTEIGTATVRRDD